MARPRLPKSVAELVLWYERYISPLSLIAGFLADNLFLTRRVDLFQTNALLFSYLAIAAVGIVLLNLIETGRLRGAIFLKIAPLIPVVVQFSFGGLFSGYLSLYSRSAGFASSWVFVALIAALLIGNERFTRLYVRFSFQISLYFTVLFSFLIFFLPVVFRKIGPGMFVLSGIASLLLIALLLLLLSYLVPEVVARNKTISARWIAGIFIAFNVLYFTNYLPPLPLALKDAGVYHSIVRGSDGSYALSGEPSPWYQTLLFSEGVFHMSPGNDTAYAFSSVFAPSGLSIVVLHEWQRYDDQSRAWVTTDTLSFPIRGGRDGGYRGYSIKYGITPGRWRVNVVTQYGQLIGRIPFTVEATTTLPALAESQG